MQAGFFVSADPFAESAGNPEKGIPYFRTEGKRTFIRAGISRMKLHGEKQNRAGYDTGRNFGPEIHF